MAGPAIAVIKISPFLRLPKIMGVEIGCNSKQWIGRWITGTEFEWV
jgi:hypothetical protein